MNMILEDVIQQEFWEKIKYEHRELVNRIVSEYEKLKEKPIVSLPYSNFRRFLLDGDRKAYEDDYFEVRKILALSCLMSLFCPDNEEYILKLQDAIWAICDEYTWVMSAHINGDKEIEQNITRIDLGASETATALVAVMKLLGDRIDDLVLRRIGYELDRRIINAFTKRSFWWEECEHNWAAVCGGGVGITFMYYKPELFKAVKRRLDMCMDGFLNGFMSDGLCKEGVSYWNYGFGAFCVYAEELRRFSDGKYNYFSREKVRKIATFRQKMFVRKGATVKIADASDSGDNFTWLGYFLKVIYGDDVTIYKPSEPYCRRYSTLMWSLLELIYYNPSMEEEYRNIPQCHYFEDSAVYIRRNEKYAFTVKAGHNDEPHNHNDVGSFTFSTTEKEILCDIGAGFYNLQYWTDGRYDIFCTSSEGHNVPIVDGRGQLPGKEYCGVLKAEGDVVTAEIAGAYERGKANNIKRTFEFLQNGIILTDKFDVANGVEFKERFVTSIVPEISGCYVKIDGVTMEYDSEKWKPELSKRLHKKSDGEFSEYNCIDFVPKNTDVYSFVIKISVC